MTQDTLELVGLFAGILITIIVVTTRLSMHPRRWTKKIIFSKVEAASLFAPPPARVSESAATARRSYLAELLGSREQPPRHEILELPDELGRAPRLELSEGEAHAQAAALRWQLTHDAYLLVGRVMDAVLSLSRLKGIPAGLLASQIRLSRLKAHTFPFEVRIATDYHVFLDIELSRFREWLGIGVSTEPPVRAKELGIRGQCVRRDGKAGCLGGGLLIPDSDCGDYFLTCAHVVSPDCDTAVQRADLSRSDTLEPDSALICRHLPEICPCFSGRVWQRGQPVRPVPTDVDSLRSLGPVQRTPGPSGHGRVDLPVPWVEYSDRLHRFPHIQIKSDVRRIMDLFYWPPWQTGFSSHGDSGSWVITADNRWLGMIVAGTDLTRLSYAVLAEPLLDYLATCPSVRAEGTQLFPHLGE